MTSCFNCGIEDFQSGVKNIVSYRCKNCNIINCLMCDSCHDTGCTIFKKASDKAVNKRPSSTQGRDAFENVKRRRQSMPFNRSAAENVKSSNRRASVPAGHMILIPDPTRIICEICDTTLSSNYYMKHLKTKKHTEAARRKIKIEA